MQPQTKKYLIALERYQRRLGKDQAAKYDPQLAHTSHFLSPGLDPPLVHRPSNLFHGLWRLDDMWINDAGNELTLPKTITQDETRGSQ